MIEDKKVILSRDVIFNELRFHKPNQLEENLNGKPNSFQLEVERNSKLGGNLDNLYHSNLENSQENNENNVPSSFEMDFDALNLPDSDLVSSSSEDLSDCWLTRDRVRRELKSPSRYAHADVIAYALNIGDTIELDEPLTLANERRDGFSSEK